MLTVYNGVMFSFNCPANRSIGLILTTTPRGFAPHKQELTSHQWHSCSPHNPRSHPTHQRPNGTAIAKKYQKVTLHVKMLLFLCESLFWTRFFVAKKMLSGRYAPTAQRYPQAFGILCTSELKFDVRCGRSNVIYKFNKNVALINPARRKLSREFWKIDGL